MSSRAIFDPDSFMRLQGLAEHPVRKGRIGHDGKEDLLGQLQQVSLVERGTRDECCADAFAAVFEFTPVGFLRYECDVVYHHKIEKGVYELCSVGAMQCELRRGN